MVAEVVQALHAVRPPLSDYVECLWYNEIPGYQGRELILPSPYIELIFNFGNPHKVLNLNDFTHFEWQRESWIAGLQTRCLAIESTSSYMIGARFKPGGAHAFLALPITEFTDRVIPLDTLFGSAALELRTKLQAASQLAGRFQLLEEFLLTRFKLDMGAYPLVVRTVAELTRTQGASGLKELSKLLGVSHKHLTNQFTRLVGIGPKQFARMLRLTSVISDLDISQPVDWLRVAHAANFYDQSHFINEFRAFTGLTPGEYLNLWKALQDRPIEYDSRFLPIG